MNVSAKKSTLKTVAIVAVVLACACAAAVPVIGVLAAVAIPAFVNYSKRAKTGEAESNLRALRTGVSAYCRGTGQLPGSAGPVPAVPGASKQIGAFDQDPVFPKVGFIIGDPLYYSYSIRPVADGVVRLVAEGDIDGDGVRSTFSLECRSAADCSCDDAISRINGLE